MDCNLIVITGRLSAEPEIVDFDSGTRLVRILVTVRTEHPRSRIDVLSVMLWNPTGAQINELTGGVRGKPIWVAGSCQRRFWSQGDGRTSRVEIVAHDIKVDINKEVSVG